MEDAVPKKYGDKGIQGRGSLGHYHRQFHQQSLTSVNAAYLANVSLLSNPNIKNIKSSIKLEQ